jgi:hypothetical protein
MATHCPPVEQVGDEALYRHGVSATLHTNQLLVAE